MTLGLGRCLAQAVRPPVWIGLDGSLGVGKTRFVQGFAAEMGVTGRVQSPTFVIENRYRGRVALWHQDLYRLAGPDDETLAGWEENEAGVILVEWAARAEEHPERAICVRIERIDSDETDAAGESRAVAETNPDATELADLDFSDVFARRFVVTWSSPDILDVARLDRAVAAATSLPGVSRHG
jgi:tRNA threonylcarbamoyladenosine biosynthesis protein TsaE